ncbi:unnamed protein product [Nyctereutes procyonoides]|uniref:RING-type E3 ubiquitin transferase n=1 Tax=Nyctereutes procyonoides TaxID=34880 RepID=A0A811ZEK4_NYCPR|nr:unnamed protein product [Nyctereutes procyonoides]
MHTHRKREREREAETQTEGEAGSMQGARCGTRSQEGDNCRYSRDLSDCPYGVACRHEHGKPLKQEDVPAADLTAKSSLAPSSSLSSGAGPVVEMNTGEAKSRNSNFAIVGAGSEDWVNAIEPVPGRAPPQGSVTKEVSEKEQTATGTKKQLWPSAAGGECPYRENRVYLHGDSCDRCGLRVLHLMDAAQRSQHRRFCIEAHGKDVELSFAVQHSKDVVYGICMEVVYEKANPSECRFGIVSNCNPTYCLKCIHKWRSAKQLESEIIKSCPQCRIPSNCVIPSEYWVEEKEEKQKLIQRYKEAMSIKACRYFDEIFYKHVYPDGRREELQRLRTTSGSSLRKENSNPSDNEGEEVVTFELVEMLLMLLATGGDDNLTDFEDLWDLFHDELEDFYDLDLCVACELVC